MGRAARKGTRGAGVRGAPRAAALEEKYRAEGILSEGEWVDLHSLQHGLDLEELPEFFRQTLYDLPASTREELLRELAEADLQKIKSPEEMLAPIRSSNSDEPHSHVENELGLQVSLDEQQRPHSTADPAVVWPNGTEGYYEHGEEVRDGRPCRIYPDGSREYLDSYDDQMEMNIYKKINEGKTEWILETGHPVRRVRDDEEKIFPAGVGDVFIVGDAYAWAGEKFHGNPDAYKEERQAKIDLQAEIGEEKSFSDRENEARRRIRALAEKRHPFFTKEEVIQQEDSEAEKSEEGSLSRAASPEELEIWEDEFLEGREPGTPGSEISPDAQEELDRILGELSN